MEPQPHWSPGSKPSGCGERGQQTDGDSAVPLPRMLGAAWGCLSGRLGLHGPVRRDQMTLATQAGWESIGYI